eukprot:TRINITY_DN57922_c0_g1_i1.p1 TRINITY_DN57922_c0_g1~~TRINITY_DN57922_c0_g1_i1.p1  ORF type:complete len:260 (-),score=16.21 TRINITY_DN57922_c0_g1_i1:96-875(-)
MRKLASAAAPWVGLDLTVPLTVSQKEKIRAELYDSPTHTFLAQKVNISSPVQLNDFAKVFGATLQPFDRMGNTVQRYVVHNRSKQLRGSDFWHSDLSYWPRPAKASMLLAVDVPKNKEGATEFCDMVAAFKDLPEELKHQLSNKWAVHTKADSNEKQTRQPVLRRHPMSGEGTVYISPGYTNALGIEGDTDGKLREAVIQHCLQDKYCFRHEWEVGDLLVWDNAAVMHRATTLHMNPTVSRVMLRACVISEEMVEMWGE